MHFNIYVLDGYITLSLAAPLQTSRLVDDMLGELQGLKSAFDNSLGQMGDRLDQVRENLTNIYSRPVASTRVHSYSVTSSPGLLHTCLLYYYYFLCVCES